MVLVNAGNGIGFGDHPAPQRNHPTALGLDYDGEGSRWSQQGLFIGMVLLPIAYLLNIVRA